MPDDIRKSTRVEWLTLVIVMVVAIGGVWKYFDTVQPAAHVLIDEATKPILQVSASAMINKPIDQRRAKSKLLLCTTYVSIKNIGRAAIDIGTIDVTFERADVDGQLAKRIDNPPDACTLESCIEPIIGLQWKTESSVAYSVVEAAGSQSLRKGVVGAWPIQVIVWEGVTSQLMRIKVVVSPPDGDKSWSPKTAYAQVALGPLRSSFGSMSTVHMRPVNRVAYYLEGTSVIPLQMKPTVIPLPDGADR